MSKKPKRTAAPRHITQPRDINRWLDRAARQLVAADYPGVIATAGRVLRAPITSREQRAEAYDRLGAAYLLLQQHEDAYAMVTAAVALTPDNPLLWYNRGLPRAIPPASGSHCVTSSGRRRWMWMGC